MITAKEALKATKKTLDERQKEKERQDRQAIDDFISQVEDCIEKATKNGLSELTTISTHSQKAANEAVAVLEQAGYKTHVDKHRDQYNKLEYELHISWKEVE